MGLTICWTLRLPAELPPHGARARVEALRRRALELPFAAVSTVHGGPGWGERFFPVGPERQACAPPVKAVRFVVEPGAGAPPATFGVARHEGRIVLDGREVLVPDAGAWIGEGGCETQAAARTGGADAFVRVHAALVALLDAAVEVGFEVLVLDDARFHERRDAARLAAELRRWSRFG